jgi:hypothetical protein
MVNVGALTSISTRFSPGGCGLAATARMGVRTANAVRTSAVNTAPTRERVMTFLSASRWVRRLSTLSAARGLPFKMKRYSW